MGKHSNPEITKKFIKQSNANTFYTLQCNNFLQTNSHLKKNTGNESFHSLSPVYQMLKSCDLMSLVASKKNSCICPAKIVR